MSVSAADRRCDVTEALRVPHILRTLSTHIVHISVLQSIHCAARCCTFQRDRDGELHGKSDAAPMLSLSLASSSSCRTDYEPTHTMATSQRIESIPSAKDYKTDTRLQLRTHEAAVSGFWGRWALFCLCLSTHSCDKPRSLVVRCVWQRAVHKQTNTHRRTHTHI